MQFFIRYVKKSGNQTIEHLISLLILYRKFKYKKVELFQLGAMNSVAVNLSIFYYCVIHKMIKIFNIKDSIFKINEILSDRKIHTSLLEKSATRFY